MKRVLRLTGPLLALLALAVYLLTLSDGLCPGASSHLVVQFTGLFPRVRPTYPIWAFLAWLASCIPVGSLATRLNVLSALCGALAVWLLHDLVCGMVLQTVRRDASNTVRTFVAARTAGTGAALFLAFCMPFWIVSNRAHTAPFHALLLLAVARLLLTYARTDKFRNALLFAFLYGVGVVEFAPFIPLAPVSGVMLLYLMWRREEIRVVRVLQLAGCAAIGLLLYLVAAWGLYRAEGYQLGQYKGYWHIVWQFWREQYISVARSLPRVGWLVVVCTTIVPWLVSLAIARRALNEEKDWTYYLLHLVMTGVSVIVVLDLKFSPWQMLGGTQLPVTSYVLASFVFGYLIAYWFLIPSSWWQDTESRRKERLRMYLGPILVVPLLALAVAAPFRNAGRAIPRVSRTVNQFARAVMDCMAGRTFLVTDGRLDNHLLVAARDMGRKLRVLNLRLGTTGAYLRHVATWFDNPALKNMADIGLVPLLEEWLKIDENVQEKIAALTAPDVWATAGVTSVPNKLVFLGVRDTGSLDSAAIMDEHRRFWKSVPFQIDEEESGPETSLMRDIVRHMGLVANNLGALMEDLGNREEAFVCYRKAREIDPGNVSALLNQLALLQAGYVADDAAEIRKEAIARFGGDRKRLNIPALFAHYGYVRLPRILAQLGWNWASAGAADLGIAQLEKALALASDEIRPAIRLRLADAQVLQGEDGRGAELYRRVLEAEPDNTRALIGLARLAVRTRDFREAASLLDRTQPAPGEELLVALERAGLLIASGEAERAQQLLEESIVRNPVLPRPWAMLVDIAVAAEDTKMLTGVIGRLEGHEGEGHYVLEMARGHLAMMGEDRRRAKAHFNRALRLRPRNLPLRESLLRLELDSGSAAAVRDGAVGLLRVDPRNALACYVMGTLHTQQEQYDLAESWLRRSLGSRKTYKALNNLAWVLLKKRSYEEAEQLVRAAIAMNEEVHHSWDTLGVILMETDRLNEAREMLEKALTLSDKNVNAALHLLEIDIRMRRGEQARKTSGRLSVGSAQMSTEQRARLSELRREAASLP